MSAHDCMIMCAALRVIDHLVLDIMYILYSSKILFCDFWIKIVLNKFFSSSFIISGTECQILIHYAYKIVHWKMRKLWFKKNMTTPLKPKINKSDELIIWCALYISLTYFQTASLLLELIIRHFLFTFYNQKVFMNKDHFVALLLTLVSTQCLSPYFSIKKDRNVFSTEATL